MFFVKIDIQYCLLIVLIAHYQILSTMQLTAQDDRNAMQRSPTSVMGVYAAGQEALPTTTADESDSVSRHILSYHFEDQDLICPGLQPRPL